MLSTICPLKLQKLAKKQNNLIVVYYCNLTCLRRLKHFLITYKKAFAQFDFFLKLVQIIYTYNYTVFFKKVNPQTEI